MNSSSNTKPELKLDWCSYKAAKYACEKWHYSGCVPVGKLVKVGVWEDGKFIGVVLFSRGANKNIGSPYSLRATQVCELTRVALSKHLTPVTKIIKVSISFLKKHSPGLELIVSYADSSQGHHGGIYQAGNWIYEVTSVDTAIIVNGKTEHKKTISSRYGTCSVTWLKSHVDPNARFALPVQKHKYLYPLTKEMRAKIEPLRKPYPKRASDKGNHPDQGQSGGAIPTRTLQPKKGGAH